MRSSIDISALFLDIGGVLLSNGWDHNMRRKAAAEFALDYDEMNDRHSMTFDTYERGLLSLDDYLKRVVFYEQRSFTPRQFKEYMFGQSRAIDNNIQYFKRIAQANGLKVGAISNEGRELTVHRIHTFRLNEVIQFFISSCFVHFRKPDEGIYRLALDIAQVTPEQAVYVEDSPMFVEVAENFGIHSILYKNLRTTRLSFEQLGLKIPDNQ
jgi:putative hydrolase of the HAD superfamily